MGRRLKETVEACGFRMAKLFHRTPTETLPQHDTTGQARPRVAQETPPRTFSVVPDSSTSHHGTAKGGADGGLQPIVEHVDEMIPSQKALGSAHEWHPTLPGLVCEDSASLPGVASFAGSIGDSSGMSWDSAFVAEQRSGSLSDGSVRAQIASFGSSGSLFEDPDGGAASADASGLCGGAEEEVADRSGNNRLPWNLLVRGEHSSSGSSSSRTVAQVRCSDLDSCSFSLSESEVSDDLEDPNPGEPSRPFQESSPGALAAFPVESGLGNRLDAVEPRSTQDAATRTRRTGGRPPRPQLGPAPRRQDVSAERNHDNITLEQGAARSSASSDGQRDSARQPQHGNADDPEQGQRDSAGQAQHGNADDPEQGATRSFDGVWVAIGQPKESARWLSRLVIQGDTVIDNEGGTRRIVRQDGKCLYERGALYRDGDRLFRIGSSGIVLAYLRARDM